MYWIRKYAIQLSFWELQINLSRTVFNYLPVIPQNRLNSAVYTSVFQLYEERMGKH